MSITIENGIYTDTRNVNIFDVDSLNRAHPRYYFDMVQEVAGSHAHHIGVSIPQLQKQNKTWVVTRTRMNIFAYASWPANLSFRTWPQIPWKLYFPRTCQGVDQNGHLLFESLSQWVVVDLDSQRPVKPDLIAQLFGSSMQDQIVDPDLGSRISFNGDIAYTSNPIVGYEDIDLNRHVNNVAYVKWMLESLPYSFKDTHVATEIDISFLAQAFIGDEIEVNTAQAKQEGENVSFLHEVVNRNSQTRLAVAKTIWKKG